MKRRGYRGDVLSMRKKYRKYVALTGLAVLLPTACIVGAQVKNNIEDVGAITSEQEIIIEPVSGGLVYSPELDAKKDTVRHNEISEIYGGYGSQDSYYNSHDKYHTYTRTKNQNTEGLCWIYANSTALEYALESSGMASSVSPKHIDYQFISASNAYKPNDVASGVKNEYYNRWLSAGGYERNFGDGGNGYTTLLSVANPYALISEPKFVDILKANDSRLSSINNYEDIWGLSNANSILTQVTSLVDPDDPEEITAYAEKQNYDDINSADNVGYIVTGVREINDPEYGAKDTTVNAIKNAVQKYGAASVSSFFDEDRCMDASVDQANYTLNLTIIDRTGSGVTCRGGHAMAIIGWDDDWEYNDNGEAKKGAFIIQNSYGDTLKVQGTDQVIEVPTNYYMSYDSAFRVMYYDSLEAFDKYDHHYSIGDYKDPTITAGNNEYVFEFASDGKEKLSEITFNQNFRDSANFDIYVSTTGEADDFAKVGDFAAHMGMTKYEFKTPINVSGDFAIKLKGSSSVEDVERDLNILNAYTKDGEVSYTGQVTWIQGEEYVIGSGEDLVVRVDYPLELLTAVTMDGENLDNQYFKTEIGSTILTIYSGYLDTLEVGEHVIGLSYSDGEAASITFAVEEDLSVPNTSGANAPETGGGIGKSEEGISGTGLVGYIAPVMFVGMAVLGYVLCRNKRQVKFERR